MEKLVVLNLGKGDWHQGCSLVTAQLWLSDGSPPMQVTGSLAAAPELASLYSRWQQLYVALYAHRGWRSLMLRASDFEIEDDENYITDVSETTFQEICQELDQALNRWLNTDSFRKIDRQLRTHLVPTDTIRCIIMAENQLLRLPWYLWHFFADYPRAELALSLPDYNRSVKTSVTTHQDQVRILAVLGNSQGINIAQDQQLLEQLPDAEVHFLVEPSLETLSQALWEPGWDLLFFAGHSSSQHQGQIQINRKESLTLDQLRYALKRAIAQGLQLAIFNSCDGLKLAWDLADLQIPQVIVMREPVPDRVAQEFLQHFLKAFSGGQSFYLAVREAREKLQALESEFLCATWLPVICQNPAELPPLWQDWCGRNQELKGRSQDSRELRIKTPASEIPRSPNFSVSKSPSLLHRLAYVFFSSLVVTGLLVGVRSLSWLQPLELWAYDRLLQLRPEERPDSRLLIVTVSEADIQAQDPSELRGSLSERSLAQLLTKLKQLQPRVIGLDIYRDFPANTQYPSLIAELRQNKQLVAICKGRDPKSDPTGIAPPPEVAEERVGFSDFVADEDGILRRQLLTMTPDPTAPCTTPYAFSARLAFRYLEQQGIAPIFTADGNLRLGKTIFHRLNSRFAGYQNIDAQGNQILLNYRSLPSPEAIAPQVSLTQVLTGQVNPHAIRDRVVLIGVTANSSGDFWSTPYGAGPTEQVAGVFIQAHMLSQLIGAVVDQRPLIKSWSWLGDALWIEGWALLGGVLVLVVRSPLYRLISGAIALGVLTGLSLLLLTTGTWVPLIPAGISLVGTGSTMVYLKIKF